MKISALLVTAAVLLPFDSAFAQDSSAGVTLGEVTYGGTGCPQGTAGVATSPDQRSLAILFDAFAAETGGEGGRPLARLACNLAIPVAVPEGLSLAIFPVDFLGHAMLPEGATLSASVEYFFAGGQGTPMSYDVAGPVDQDFLVQFPLSGDALTWSDCGGDVILRTNANLLLLGGADRASASIEAAVGYRLQWRAC